jgi:hypothetical protein
MGGVVSFTLRPLYHRENSPRLPVVWYGCETWCHTLKEEYRVRVSITPPKTLTLMMETEMLVEMLESLQHSTQLIREVDVVPILKHQTRNAKDKNNLRVFEKRVMRRIFGPKRDEVTGASRELRNEELHNLYTLQI